MSQPYRMFEHLLSEKDTRPHWETERRGFMVPIMESGYNRSFSPALPSILGGGSFGVFRDIVDGKPVTQDEVEHGAKGAADFMFMGGLAGNIANKVPKGGHVARAEARLPNGTPISDAAAIAVDGAPTTGTIRVYHGTRNDFDRFQSGSQIGPHFGNKDQSARFSRGDGGRVIPVDLTVNNPLHLPDMSKWKNDAVSAQLSHMGIEGAPTSNKGDMRKFLVDRGYDAIRYSNMLEGDGWSYIALKPGSVRNAITGDVMYSNAKPAAGVTALNHLTADQRRARPSWLDYDVPEAQQIVRGVDGNVYSNAAANALFSQYYKSAQ